MADTMIEILFIANASRKNNDERVLIEKNHQFNEFEVTYTDPNTYGPPIVHKVSGLYRDRLMTYVYMLIKNQAVDEESAVSIQVNIPAMPRVILSVNKLNDLYFREHLVELIGVGADLLENTTRVLSSPVKKSKKVDASYSTPSARSTAPGVYPQHLYFD